MSSHLFANTIAQLREGTTSAELDQELTKLVEVVRQSGRPGKLVLELAIKPASKGQTTVLSIADKITIKQPVSERGDTILFAGDDNILTRTDPRQPELKGLRDVTKRGAALPPTTATETPDLPKEATGS